MQVPRLKKLQLIVPNPALSRAMQFENVIKQHVFAHLRLHSSNGIQLGRLDATDRFEDANDLPVRGR
jgi:hypothetical protein